MPEEASERIELRDFPGIQLEVDSHALLTGGSHDQVNIASSEIGRIRTRSGIRVLEFD